MTDVHCTLFIIVSTRGYEWDSLTDFDGGGGGDLELEVGLDELVTAAAGLVLVAGVQVVEDSVDVEADFPETVDEIVEARVEPVDDTPDFAVVLVAANLALALADQVDNSAKELVDKLAVFEPDAFQVLQALATKLVFFASIVEFDLQSKRIISNLSESTPERLCQHGDCL